MISKQQVIHKFIFDFFCILALYLFSLRVILSGSLYQVLASILTFPYLIYIIKNSRKCSSGMCIFFIYFILTLISSVLNTLFTDNGLGGCLILIATLTLGIYCINNLAKLRFHILIILIINITYIINNVVFLGIDPNFIYESLGLSRNHGGMILCLFTGFYCFIIYQNSHKASFVIPLISLFCAYLMSGRSSMGLLAAMFLVSLYAGEKKTIAMLITVIILLLYMEYKEEIEILYNASSFGEHGMESSRFTIWKSYFKHLSFETTIFGPETNEIPIVKDYGGNPHNSFLNFHRRLGIIPLVFFIIISFFSLFKYWEKRQYYICSIIVIIFSRIFFDSDCFIGNYDYIIYAMIFYPLIHGAPIKSNFGINPTCKYNIRIHNAI